MSASMTLAHRPRIYLSPAGNLAYFHAPKCASRTILGWMTLAKIPDLQRSNPGLFDPFLLGDYPRFSQEIPEVTLREVEGKEKFCVVRDPIERFISAYCDRVLRYRQHEMECFPTLASLISNIRHLQGFKTLEHHIRPLVTLYGSDTGYYDRIFRFNEIGELKKYLEEKMGVQLPDLRLQSCERIEKPVLTSEDEAVLRDFYREDYQVFHQYLT